MTPVERARAILRANDRGGYTVPTARLYPFQWNWDSAFVAMGWATFDGARAWDEMEFLLRGQWEDGLIPQIVFHAPSDDYFPGPDVWGIHRDPPTSGITQPPVLATAARHVLEATEDAPRMAAMYPRLVRNHRWWEAARDPAHTGLVTTLHPWETGMDNSPAWDRPLARVPLTTVTRIVRRDTGHIDPSMRPRGEEYQRFIHLVDAFRAVAWDPARMLDVSPFRVADIGTNASTTALLSRSSATTSPQKPLPSTPPPEPSACTPSASRKTSAPPSSTCSTMPSSIPPTASTYAAPSPSIAIPPSPSALPTPG